MSDIHGSMRAGEFIESIEKEIKQLKKEIERLEEENKAWREAWDDVEDCLSYNAEHAWNGETWADALEDIRQVRLRMRPGAEEKK